jgi:CheY-like chemotaxis protein
MGTERKPRILFVDDDLPRLSSLLHFFSIEGFEIFTADNAESAVRFLDEHRSELAAVVLDMIMPASHGVFSPDNTELGYRTGIRLVEEIKRRAPDVPLVMLTVVHDPKAREQALALGASVYVTKPVLPSELIKTVREVMKKERHNNSMDADAE